MQLFLQQMDQKGFAENVTNFGQGSNLRFGSESSRPYITSLPRCRILGKELHHGGING